MPDQTALDRFMEQLRARLAAVPEAYREDEIRELRQHLEALVEEHRATGLGEPAALAAAIDRFGQVEEVGRRLAAAYRRPQLAEYIVYAVFMLIVQVPMYLGLRAVLDPLFGTDPGTWTSRLRQGVVLSCFLTAMSIAFRAWGRRRAIRGRRTRFDRYLRYMTNLDDPVGDPATGPRESAG